MEMLKDFQLTERGKNLREPRQEQQPQPQQNFPPPKLPFMATGVSEQGEPYYNTQQQPSILGSFGFQEWARKTFSRIFDPSVSSPFLSDEQRQAIPRVQQNLQTGLVDTLKWDDWIGKVTGITSEEAAEAVAPMAAETDFGEYVANVFSLGKRSVGQGFWTGLNLLGGLDYLQRRVTAVSQTFDEVADTVSNMPDIPHYGDFRDYIVQASPISFAYNAIRFARSPVSVEEKRQLVQDTLTRNLNSSKFVYSLYWDQSKKEDYIRRYEAGENPELLALEMANPWVELGGSIFLDPSTYFGIGYISKFGKIDDLAKPARFFGMKLPWEMKYLPTFGDMIGLTIGKGRIANDAARAFEYADPAMGKALRQLENAPDDIRALEQIKNSIYTVKNGIDEVRNPGKKMLNSIFSWSSTAKSNLFARDVGQTINTILASNPNSQELVDEVIPAMIKLVRGTDLEIADAISALSNSRVPMEAILSERGIKAAEGIARLVDDGIADKILSNQGDVVKMGDDLLNAIGKLSQNLYPSVDEMEKAAEAVASGKKVAERTEQLAEYYKSVPEYVKNIRTVTKKYEKVWRPITGTMANIYIRLNPAFTPRNILGQGIGVVIDLGVGDAAAITARSFTAYSGKFTDTLIQHNADEILKLAGAIPKRMSAGFGGQDVIKVGAASRSEAIASSEIFLRVTRNVIEDAMKQGAFPGVDALTRAGLADEDAKLLLGIMKKNYGFTGKSWDEFRKVISDGTLDTFRMIDPPAKVKKMLTDSHLWDKFDNLRANATSADEFSQGLAKLKEEYIAAAGRVMNDGAAIASEVPPPVQEIAQDIGKLADDGEVSNEAADLFTRMVQGWRNARASNDQLVMRIQQDLHLVASQSVGPEQAAMIANKYTEEFSVARSAYDNIYGGIDRVRNQVRKLAGLLDEGEPIQNVLAQARVPKNTKEMLWELTGDFVSRKDLRNALWESYFEFGRQSWRTANETLIGGNMAALKRYAEEVGAKLDDLAKSGNYSDLLVQSDKDYRIANELDDLFSKTPLGPEFKIRPGTPQNVGEIARIAQQYGISSLSESGARLDKKLLNIINKYSDEGQKFEKLADVPKGVAEKVFSEYSKTSEAVSPGVAKILAPNAEEGGLSMARALYENTDGFFADLDKYGDEIIGRWGETKQVASRITPEVEAAWMKWAKETDKRMGLVRGKALTYAEGMRDFLLHDYNKTYADLAIAYLSPFHYWTNRTYMRYLERVIDNPRTASMYLKYRQFLEREHAGLPDWWKYNIPIKGLPGMGDTPLMFNLEATINPLNGLTGVDFNDPYKRVDWLSSIVDDVQKFGPTLMTPINWAVAYELYAKGEEDAAKRWMGRLIPQTQAIKAGLSLANIRLPETPFSRHNELDPFVNFLMNGVDPYEERRVGRALGGMVLDGMVTPEQAIDSSLYQDDQIWDNAIERAIDERAAGQLFSFFAGVGFKPRSEGDIMVDQFYDEYFQLVGARESMSGLDYANAMDQLREKYPFMDTVLVGKRAGPERESAYSYNVLARIPPGMSDDIAERVGLDYGLVNKFYDSKGDMSTWSKADKDKFMGSILQLGTLLAIPEAATKSEWNAARATYKDMQVDVKRTYGDDIYDKIDTYYSIDNPGQARMFLTQNPEVQAAMDYQSGLVVQNPLLMQYYGGIDKLERYYYGLMYDELEKRFGTDITEKEQVYYDLKRNEALGLVEKGTARDYAKKNGLSGDNMYWDTKDAMKKVALNYVINFGSVLPETPQPQLRSDITPEQRQLIEPPPQVDWEAVLGGPTTELIYMSYLEGEDIPSVIQSELEYQAGKYGMDAKDLYRDVLLYMVDNYGAPQQ